jgi:hypothetical protein
MLCHPWPLSGVATTTSHPIDSTSSCNFFKKDSNNFFRKENNGLKTWSNKEPVKKLEQVRTWCKMHRKIYTLKTYITVSKILQNKNKGKKKMRQNISKTKL